MKIIRKRPASSLAPRPGRRHRCTRRDRAVTGAKLLHHPPGAVLVVDDDPAQRALLGNMLGRLGHRCVAVAGPVQASACLRDTAVVAVLLALRPAGDSWLGMARCLADRPSLPLIVTGTCDERTRRAAMRLARACGVSVAGALGQPVRAAELAALLAASTGNDALQAPDARAEPAEEDFASALATGRIRPAFQPKVGLADGRVVGVEALARWYSPREDPVGPERFVPLAAGWGRLAELTDVILSASLASCSRWRRDFPSISVAVNLDPSLVEPGFLDTVRKRLLQYGVPPGSLVLEITERSALSDSIVAREALTRIRIDGVQLSIDDFGTGYACLTSLLDVPFNELKLDRRFVGEALRDPDARRILHATVALARELGMRCVAEGVEQRAIAESLQLEGCDAAQGWLWAPPMDEPALLAWLSDHAHRVPNDRHLAEAA
ncbi:EAL domain-containing protein [Burkholderia gladioli]|uniref:EAL domain-containing protein n=1 Tax=Burkholderia gladioli TaxID=28095 RepID=UPI0016404BA9|nr:EAL domain-containing protein [Burkholderia gladioli]